jgi:predicted hotdog family 3-hydroxylacyl-ACP dehydratase
MMETVLVSQEHITEYIPQAAPMVMIGDLISCEELSATTRFPVTADNLFVKDGRMHEPGLIENIAQTAAAKAGYEIKKRGMPPSLGFIGGIKDLKIYQLPAVGETLETTVTIKTEIMGVTLIEGRSTCQGQAVASCEMKIFIQQPS